MMKTKQGQTDLAAEEKALMEKYPDRNIVKGSIRDAGALSEFGNKRTVEIRCSGGGETGKGCKAVRRVATSDLHQVSMCPDCVRRVRLERRRDARAARRKETKHAAKAGTTSKALKPIREKVLGDKAAPIRSREVPIRSREVPTDEFLEKQLAETED